MTTDDADHPGDVSRAWFAAGDGESPADRVRDGDAEAPADWPALAVETGFVGDENDYYAKLREATVEAARAEVDERERADDRQLLHAVRAMDDIARILV